MKHMKYILAHRLRALHSVIPFSRLLQNVVDKDFQHFSSKEGYELLSYLLVACGIPLDINPTYIHLICDVPRKDQHPGDKMIIERCKTEILEAVKKLSQKIKPAIKPLRKSDLVGPSTQKYFSSCLLLSHFALDQQLGRFGINVSGLTLNGVLLDDFLTLYDSFKKQEKELENGSRLLSIQTEEYLEETMNILKDVNNYKKMKNEVNALIHEEIKRCPLMYRDELKDPSTQNDAIANWSTYLDEKSLSNNNKIAILGTLEAKLKMLCGFMNGKIEEHFIDGNDLASSISDEVLLFTHQNKVDLLNENKFNILALLQIILLSIPKSAIDIQELNKITDHISTPHNSKLYESLIVIEEKLETEISKLRSSLGTSVDPESHQPSLNQKEFQEFYVTIPELVFTNKLLPTPVTLRDPFIDNVKLEAMLTS